MGYMTVYLPFIVQQSSLPGVVTPRSKKGGGNKKRAGRGQEVIVGKCQNQNKGTERIALERRKVEETTDYMSILSPPLAKLNPPGCC